MEDQRIRSHSIYRRGGEKKWTLEVRRKDSATSRTRWPTRGAAREELARLVKLDESGVVPLGPRTPFIEVVDAWQRWYASTAGIRPKTIETHQGAINAWIAPEHGRWGFVDHRIASVTREEIVGLMALMRRSIKTDGVPGPRLLLGPLGPMLHDYVDSNITTGYLWPRLGGRQLNPDNVQRAAVLRAQGFTWSAIGRKLGVSDVWAKQLWQASQGERSYPDEPASASFFRRNVWGPALKEVGLGEYIARDLRNTCIVHLIDGDMTGEPWEQPAVAHHVDHDLRMTQQIHYRFRPERLTRMQGNSHSLAEMSVDEAMRRYRPAGST